MTALKSNDFSQPVSNLDYIYSLRMRLACYKNS